MQPRKLRVGFAFFPYGGNGASSSEIPQIRNWLVGTVMRAKADPRIEDIVYEDFSDTPITMTRNRSIKWARENAVDVLVMVDSDQVPDLYYGKHPAAKNFFESSFDFLYERYERQCSVIVAPYCGPPSHPTDGGMENVYVFRWANQNTGHNEEAFKLEAYSRSEAAMMTGISNVDTGPTGCCMIDVRIFDDMVHPFFDYEWEGENVQCPHCKQQIPGERAQKASTEDCFFFRNIAMHFVVTRDYNPVFCNWDAWAGHMKPWCVGKPNVITSDQVGRIFQKAVLETKPSNIRLKQFGKSQDELRRESENPVAGIVMNSGSEDYHAYDMTMPESNGKTHAQCVGMVDMFQGRFADELDESPKEDDLGWKMPNDDLKALEIIVEDFARANPGKPLRIVELGTWVGKSALAMVAGIPPGWEWEVHCDFPYSANVTQKDQFDRNTEHIGSVTNGIFQLFKPDAPKEIDILFIHSDKHLDNEEIASWYSRLRDGGIAISSAEASDRLVSFPQLKKCGIRWHVKNGDTNDSGEGSASAVCQLSAEGG